MKKNINHDTAHMPVQSSNMRSAGYDEETGDLHVTFHDGGRYVYHNVSPSKYQGFMMSSSKGGYLHAQIKGEHEYTKL